MNSQKRTTQHLFLSITQCPTIYTIHEQRNGQEHAHMHKNAYAVTFIHKQHQEYLTLPSSTKRVHQIICRTHIHQTAAITQIVHLFRLGSGNGRTPSFVMKGLVSRKAFRRASISPLDGAMPTQKVDPFTWTSRRMIVAISPGCERTPA